MTARRGEVWLTIFDPVEGHEQAGRRPALVLSADEFNASRAELVTVLPLTSKYRPHIPSRACARPDTPEAMLEGVPYVVGVTGAPILEGAIAHLECQVAASFEFGTHTIFVGEAVALGLPATSVTTTSRR